MESINYLLIGFCMFLLSTLLSLSSEINKANKEINRTNRKLDKIMEALNINYNEYDYDEINNELKAIINDKGKIKAIKRYREITDVGLKEAKEYVDNLK